MKDGNSLHRLSERSAAARKRRERDTMRDAGFCQITYWVHGDELERARKYLKRLKDKHALQLT
jgi:hypothetical protein